MEINQYQSTWHTLVKPSGNGPYWVTNGHEIWVAWYGEHGSDSPWTDQEGYEHYRDVIAWAEMDKPDVPKIVNPKDGHA